MTREASEIHALAFWQFQARPLLAMLYREARLVYPSERFDWATEGPRLVAALRNQGFDFHFIDKQGEEVS